MRRVGCRVRAPTKVVVFQWPCGTDARHRYPRGAQPRRRAIFVERPLSSMKNKRSGSSSGCIPCPISRAPTFTSGALLLTRVGSLFLCVMSWRSRNFQTAVDTTLTSRSRARCSAISTSVMSGNRVNQAKNKVCMGVENRTLRFALLGWRNLALRPLQSCPGARSRNPNRKPRRRLTRRHPALQPPQSPVRANPCCKACPSESPGQKPEESNHNSPDLGIPSDSCFREFALGQESCAPRLTDRRSRKLRRSC